MKYRMQVRITGWATVEVEAPSREQAREVAVAMAAGMTHALDYRVESVTQLGEPWVRGEWYDLHDVSDIVVCHRAEGNRFTAQDVELLARRLRALGLTVVEHWNGAGCDSVSFKCSGPLTAEQVAVLCAPRVAS